MTDYQVAQFCRCWENVGKFSPLLFPEIVYYRLNTDYKNQMKNLVSNKKKHGLVVFNESFEQGLPVFQVL